MRDRLIELLKKARIKETYTTSDGKPVTTIDRCIVDFEEVSILADHLLTNGVIVPPCKVGDKVYCIFRNRTPPEWYIEEKTVYAINIYTTGLSISVSPIISYIEMEMGVRLFLTKKEAEQALEKLKGGAE